MNRGAKKRLAQDKVYDLGLDDVNLGKLDLSQLIGGQRFNVDSQIAYNTGISIPMSTLADTGANGYLFIDTQQVIEMAKVLWHLHRMT